MVAKCANPECSTPFQYWREGKLFRFEEPQTSAERSRPHLVGDRKPARRVEHFWLCGPCSTNLTLSFEGGGVIVAPLVPAKARSAIAS